MAVKLEGTVMQEVQKLGSARVSDYLEVKEWSVQRRNTAGLSGQWVISRAND